MQSLRRLSAVPAGCLRRTHVTFRELLLASRGLEQLVKASS